MGKLYEEITPDLTAWIHQQHVFFVATSPLAATGHVNASPKGLDCFRVVNPRQVAYLDVTGSGAETIAHVRENGRIVLMFCAFSGPPKIVRLHGQGTIIARSSPDWSAWCGRFPTIEAPRSVVVVDVLRVSDSCGYGVPRMDFKEDRNAMARWAATKGPAALPAYRLEKNTQSILISDQPQQAHSVSQWDKKMGAFHQEMRHANEPSPVPEGPVDAGVP